VNPGYNCVATSRLRSFIAASPSFCDVGVTTPSPTWCADAAACWGFALELI
jgi:hypothetical protein